MLAPVSASQVLDPTGTDTLRRLTQAAAPTVTGRVTSAVGLSVDVDGLDLAVGEAVSLEGDAGSILAEVVALHGDAATCMPVSAPARRTAWQPGAWPPAAR